MSAGFAFFTLDGKAVINTTAETIRACQVNSIVLITNGRVWITNQTTSEGIENYFNQVKVGMGEIYPVEITRKPNN